MSLETSNEKLIEGAVVDDMVALYIYSVYPFILSVDDDQCGNERRSLVNISKNSSSFAR